MKVVISVEDACTASILLIGRTEEEVFEKLCKHSYITSLKNDLEHYGWEAWHQECRVILCQEDHPHWDASIATCPLKGKISGKFDDLSHLLDAYRWWQEESASFLEVVDLPVEPYQSPFTGERA